ncbi:MAG: hypothetical protein IPG23_00275 [Burkholderiales bacterium]|nr:hypothetical protein [Burkholderiales bacterium]
MPSFFELYDLVDPVDGYPKGTKPEDMGLGSDLNFLARSCVAPALPDRNPESMTDRAMSSLESTKRSAELADMA